MNEDFKRVFIHELGHFIALELNFRLYNYDRRAIGLKIEPRINTKFYNGSISTDKATTGSYNPINSAKEYAQTFYGCLFESLYRNIDIKSCLKSSVSKTDYLVNNIGNGKVDALHLYSISIRPELKDVGKKWFNYATENFYPLIKNNVSHFKTIFDLSPENYIVSKQYNQTTFDINKLRNATIFFVLEHSDVYDSFIKSLESIK